MQFKPNSADEIAVKTKPLTGYFPAHVHTAEDCQSKKNVDMIKLSLTVYAGERQLQKECYLHPAMEVLVYNFCQHAGLSEEYNNGELRAELCEGKDVMVKLGIEKGKDGYADKSAVKDFVSRDTPETQIVKKPEVAPRAGVSQPFKTTTPDEGDSSGMPF